MILASHVRIATGKLRCLTKGKLDSRVPRPYRDREASAPYEGCAWFSLSPFVSRTRCFSCLRMVSFLFASHLRIATRKLPRLTEGMPGFRSRHSYPGLDASHAYEWSASFSRPTSVSRPGSFRALRRVSLILAPHLRIATRKLPRPTKGDLDFCAVPSYRDREAKACTYMIWNNRGI